MSNSTGETILAQTIVAANAAAAAALAAEEAAADVASKAPIDSPAFTGTPDTFDYKLHPVVQVVHTFKLVPAQAPVLHRVNQVRETFALVSYETTVRRLDGQVAKVQPDHRYRETVLCEAGFHVGLTVI